MTFSDGPDPDAPESTDLWNTGLTGKTERSPPATRHAASRETSLKSLEELSGGGYQYSKSGYQVKRLERVISKISTSEKEFSAVDREREDIMKQVEELSQRADGLSLQAKDIREDLTVHIHAHLLCTVPVCRE